MKDFLKKYRKDFSEKKLSKKLRNTAKYIGPKVMYPVLLLYYAYHKKETPPWAKKIITGVIGYFIMPFDLIPDFLMPVIGYTDDLSVLSFGILALTAHIDQKVVKKSRNKLTDWFGEEFDTSELDETDRRLEEKRNEAENLNGKLDGMIVSNELED